MKGKEEQQTLGETDETRRLRWRLEFAARLGYEAEDALAIAEGRIDLHSLEDLILNGCDRHVALNILG
jgi:hypothetical protein